MYKILFSFGFTFFWDTRQIRFMCPFHQDFFQALQNMFNIRINHSVLVKCHLDLFFSPKYLSSDCFKRGVLCAKLGPFNFIISCTRQEFEFCVCMQFHQSALMYTSKLYRYTLLKKQNRKKSMLIQFSCNVKYLKKINKSFYFSGA